MTQTQMAILRTLTYFSIFKHPLKIDEIHNFLLFHKCSVEEAKEEAKKLKSDGKIFEIDGFFMIENKKDWVVNRIKGEKLAKKFWLVAKFMAHLIKRFPFVRAIFISGSLAKWNVSFNTDIDFFIITKSNRLWLTRSFLIAFKKLFLFNSKKFFCLNYFITDDHLEIEDKNIFTAIEIASVKPIYNQDMYFKFIDANAWVKNYLPNFSPYQVAKPISNRISLFQTVSENLFELTFNNNRKLLDKFDLKLMEKWKEIWKRRYPGLTDEERDLMFRCRPYASKAHPNNFQGFVLKSYNERIKIFMNGEEI